MTRTGRSTILFELLDACTRDGCPVCRLVLRSAARFFDTLTYENTNDPGIRAELRASLGFCNRHAWRYAEYRDSLGTAIIYRDVLREVLRRVSDEHEEPLEFLSRAAERVLDLSGARDRDRVITALAPAGPCLVCRQEETTSRNALDALLRRLGEADVTEALARSAGLCRRHLLLGVHIARLPAQRSTLLEAQQEAWRRLREQVAAGNLDAAAAALAGNVGAF